MRNKEFYKLLKKNKSKSNSGFTLTELLVGLFMSIFVIGALGFGLMTVLRTTQSENSKVKARTENSRALDFVSDEVRRAKNIETDAVNAGTAFNSTGKTIVFALDIPEITSTAVSARGRIVYYLQSTGNGNWKGPQVLYRWGPSLDANGDYTPVDTTSGEFTNATPWQYEALIDGIGVKKDDGTIAEVSTPCTTGTVTPANPTGFYACITGTNTAQLYLTGQTKTASGVNNDSQTNDTQVVARARETLPNQTNIFNSINWSVKGLGGAFGCKSAESWDMRTDFGNNSADPDKTTKWIQSEGVDKQPQPIEIDSTKDLKITSSAVGKTGCINDEKGNPGIRNQNELLSTYTQNVSHTIDFDNPTTFNGDREGEIYNDPKVKTPDETVQFFKKGYTIPSYGGYDANNNGSTEDPGDQVSLGKFLFNQGLAIPVGAAADPNLPATTFKLPTTSEEINGFLASTAGLALTAEQKKQFRVLGDDQRIIAFEIGQINPNQNNDGTAFPNNPGFDLQDNIFIVTSDVFKKKFSADSF